MHVTRFDPINVLTFVEDIYVMNAVVESKDYNEQVSTAATGGKNFVPLARRRLTCPRSFRGFSHLF
jgi:hypothetical protein